ncbi:Fic-DOC domain mobile mystery protein B [Polynucleobacter sphagniphilus]|jgi:Fic-DOC domain mobile mystery protein B|uniref:mobile mystery protein B n=1 Tax=Polynucleobacter sphagniphilus TaxID=1743169 RepID=UPI002406517A|nr:mobile mystery protein B [Polynucleobacter sphagniphilus]MDF9787524.1 Fic-DOC domain mobile mystery protein B [Polynucleobacter sphagniphilus]MDH6240374.1 Fic-DOC domain mobile mystery protein B [Polynucleobacter sphagniphilus]MDH6300850.1 Fic-DOC domain mobile mystery protein B [Polynucleobacter sphagniphilus]
MVMQFDYAPGATPIDPDEALGLIPAHIKTQADLNAWEELNIVEGADWIARQKIIHGLNEGLVRDLHSRMFNQTWQWAGTFRKSAKSIGIDWTHIAVALKNLLDNTAYQIENKTMPIDEVVVRLHHQLVLIDAFPNGNGRHARLIADALIVSLGGKRFSWGGNTSITTPGLTRQNYLSALRSADKGDMKPLMLFARQ